MASLGEDLPVTQHKGFRSLVSGTTVKGQMLEVSTELKFDVIKLGPIVKSHFSWGPTSAVPYHFS